MIQLSFALQQCKQEERVRLKSIGIFADGVSCSTGWEAQS